ncbi:hypothetical protein PMV51_16420 [Enterococcus avium]|uniref:glycosyltransferase family 2 protein n=1 Tax=Enterococcus avium TaxID=33945 RepID=UPI00232D3D42|nr:hypothetical protein [Enterococcus avium]MDB1750814.1 hypothetical protein [Enterococcus avium]MDB1754870.1 hypothetical protein [Enterococcus avium]MDB1761956.1 hypothetical protein [Enterococcus avium]
MIDLGDKKINKYDFLFVILVYRFADDLIDFDSSLKEKIQNYKVVVVNSYLDDESEEKICSIASELHYDFLSIQNKGYGYGNNKGIQYAMERYDYKYLIICNADIIIRSFDTSKLPLKNAVIGPAICTINGKSQNPYWAVENKPMEKMIYNGLRRQSRLRMIVAQGCNKIIRELFLKTRKKSSISQVYGVHGAFIIFTHDVIEKLFPIYDENMFLYYEEAYLAEKLQKQRVKKYYYPLIDILHKEDGSTKGMDFDQHSHASSSYVYYYETYVLGREK